jgi:hypothetical protein
LHALSLCPLFFSEECVTLDGHESAIERMRNSGAAAAWAKKNET